MNNPSVFPTNASNYGHFPSSASSRSEPGMTLRDYFAGQALIGLLTSPLRTTTNRATIARESYTLADALLAEVS